MSPKCSSRTALALITALFATAIVAVGFTPATATAASLAAGGPGTATVTQAQFLGTGCVNGHTTVDVLASTAKTASGYVAVSVESGSAERTYFSTTIEPGNSSFYQNLEVDSATVQLWQNGQPADLQLFASNTCKPASYAGISKVVKRTVTFRVNRSTATDDSAHVEFTRWTPKGQIWLKSFDVEATSKMVSDGLLAHSKLVTRSDTSQLLSVSLPAGKHYVGIHINGTFVRWVPVTVK